MVDNSYFSGTARERLLEDELELVERVWRIEPTSIVAERKVGDGGSGEVCLICPSHLDNSQDDRLK